MPKVGLGTWNWNAEGQGGGVEPDRRSWSRNRPPSWGLQALPAPAYPQTTVPRPLFSAPLA